MARFNEILVGRYNRGLQKLLGIKGGAVAPQLSTEIQPVLPLFTGREHSYLESWALFGVADTMAASVGNTSAGQLRNPAGSNLILVVEGVLASSADVAFQARLRHGPQTSDQTTVITPGRLDARGSINSVAVVSRGNLGGGPANQIGAANLNASVTWQFIQTRHQEIPVLPGDALFLITDATNLRLTFGFLWRERFLEESERT